MGCVYLCLFWVYVSLCVFVCVHALNVCTFLHVYSKVVDKDPWKSSGTQTGLQQLKIARNRLQTFPGCLACLAPNLEALDLSDNPLDGVIPIPDMPSSLKELSLKFCGLKNLLPWRNGPETVKECFGGCRP